MADRRRVSVHLELEVARYVGSAAQAPTGTRRVSSTMDDLGDEADGTSRDMAQLAANTDIAARQVDDLGDEARMTAAELMLLENRLNSTGRAAAKAAGGAGSSAVDFGGQGIRMRHALITTLISGVVMASPILGAMIAGAITGAVGAGGIAGGIAMASKDARVRAAAREFGDNISDEFFSGGQPFVAPILDSLEILEDAFRDMDLGGSFGRLAPHVSTLADGLGDMMRNIMPGLNQAFDRMGPFIDALADGLGDLGTQLGDFFNRLSRSHGAVMGLESLFHFLNGTLVIVGATLEFLSNRYMDFIDFVIFSTGVLEDVPFLPFQDTMREINDAFEEMRNQTDRLPPSVDQATRSTDALARSADEAKDAFDQLNETLFGSHDAQLRLQETNLRQANAWDQLRDSVKENGNAIRGHSDAARANLAMILGLVRGILDIREANIKAGMATAEANRIYAAQIKQLQANLRQMGFNEAAIADIVAQYARIPRNITTRITIIHDESFVSHREGERSSSGRAAGGPVLSGRTYRVNEQVPEGFLWRAPGNGMVMPLSQMRSAGGRSSGGLTISAQPFVLNVPGHRIFQDFFDQVVREVGDRGGTLAVIGIRD